jgi:lipopolysaccharide/colanic/teichoic acid biosynthesis glycosyltransferase
MKRVFDVIISTLAIVALIPFLVIIGVLIKFDDKGHIFYLQERIGINQTPFKLIKFRTMQLNSDRKGYLTVGMRDSRITKIGYYLRKYKLDELPQLFNVLIGDMSLVGPRPEVQKYVNYYSKQDLTVLSVRPGITDYASLKFIKENELLLLSSNPEETYIKEILPQKLILNRQYIMNHSLWIDVKIICKTIAKIILLNRNFDK